jgi:hypothetical protein
MIVRSPCPDCGHLTAELNNEREWHYRFDQESNSLKLCERSNVFFFTWTNNLTETIAYLGDDIIVHYKLPMALEAAAAWEEEPPVYKPEILTWCERCQRNMPADIHGRLYQHLPSPNQTYSADRNCGEPYTWYPIPYSSTKMVYESTGTSALMGRR